MAPASWGGRKLLNGWVLQRCLITNFYAVRMISQRGRKHVRTCGWKISIGGSGNVSDVLMDGTQPEGGRWNFDAENRKPPPKDGRSWPAHVGFRWTKQITMSYSDSNAWGSSPMGLGLSLEVKPLSGWKSSLLRDCLNLAPSRTPC